MERSRCRPPPVPAKPLHSRSQSVPEKSTLERQNSVEDDDSQSYRSGSSGDPMSPTTYEEFVKSKGMIQEDQEVWMSMADAASSVISVQRSLDSWKSRRRRATHSALERKASREEVEQNEQSRQRRRSKTYQEMMEEKEKREKILMNMATKNKSLDAEDIVHILTKPSLYEDEIGDVPEHRPRSKSIPGNYKHGELVSPLIDSANPPFYCADSTDAPHSSHQSPPSVFPKPKIRRSGVGSAFAPYQRADNCAFSNGEGKSSSGHHVDDYTDLRPGYIEPLTFREKLLRDREREIGLKSEQRNTESSARLPQKKRLSLGIMGRVAAFNKGDFEEERKAEEQTSKQVIKLEPEYTELTLQMKQRPRNENGFGFTIVGGADSGRSIIVSSITPGSTAEKCGLKVGDVIVVIDGEKTKLVTYDHAMYCFNSSTLSGELFLKIRRYEDPTMRLQPSKSMQNTEHTHSKSDSSELMREEETRLEELNKKREEETMKSAAKGKQNWNHSNTKPVLLRSDYNDHKTQEEHLGDTIPSGLSASPVFDHQYAAGLRHQGKQDKFLMLEKELPVLEQGEKLEDAGIQLLNNGKTPKQDTMSTDARVVLDESKDDTGETYSSQGQIGAEVEVGVEIVDANEIISKTEVAKEQSVNLLKVLKMPLSDHPLTEKSSGPDGVTIEDSSGNKAKLAFQEDFQMEESPISLKYSTHNECAPSQASSQPSAKSDTTMESSKGPKYHPVNFSAGPKPFTNRLGPEPYKPPGFKSVSMKDTTPDIKDDMLKRRSDFFNDEKEKIDASGTVMVATVTTDGRIKEPGDTSAILKPELKLKGSLSTRRVFNVEEEKKRLERWHTEQERIRQEQYEQEQRRLREQQEKDLEKAETEERRRKIEEHQRLLEKQKVLQEQAAEERKQLEAERKARVRQEQEFLEQARLEREEAERERLKDEKEQQKMVAERIKREEEALKKGVEKEKRKEVEEQSNRQREKDEWHHQELERHDQEAETRRIDIDTWEKEANERAGRKEEEARMALEYEDKEKKKFAQLREEEIERIRLEEREKLRKEWEDLQRERAKQEQRERLELERLEQLRAEQERLRQERIKLEQQQEEEKCQLQREKERLMAQPKMSFNNLDKVLNSEDPEVIKNGNHFVELDKGIKEKKNQISKEKPDIPIAPPNKKDRKEDIFSVPGQSYLSQYKDGNVGTQHWVIEEAERRRLAEKNKTIHLHDPIKVHTGPILRKDLDVESVVEKKSHNLEQVAPINSHVNKPVMFQELTKSGDQDNQQQNAAPQQLLKHGFREVAVDVPVNYQAAPRRLRGTENETERKKKIQNRQSLPDLGNHVPDVVRNESHTPPPRGSNRNSAGISDNFLQLQQGLQSRTSAFQQPSKNPASGRSVSGKVTCSNCAKSLGRGAAMIIESLGLHFHIECFRCCVCNIQLGNGTQGTDVRIRASRLHCQNCYSNDAGFEFTEV